MTDSFIPRLSYGDFIAHVGEKTGQKRLLCAGTIEVTPYCNLKCAHCYISHCHWEGHILSYQELCRILDETVEEGCLWLLLTGGEPFVRDDFLDIYTYAKKKGMIISIFTNGTLVTPEIAQYLHDWPPQLVEISIYGATQATHESVTGVAGSFAHCLRGIELLLEQKIRLKLKTTVMTLNKHEIWEMKELAKGYGIPFRFDSVLNPGLDGSRHPCKLRIPPEEVVSLDVEDPEYYETWLKSCQAFVNLPAPRDTLFTCGAGIGRFHIDAFGRLQMCTIAREPSYDLRQGSFREGWREFLPTIVTQKLGHYSPCRSCQYRPVCLICPGWTQLEYGVSDEKPVEYLCQVARLRAEAFGLVSKNAPEKGTISQSALNRPSGRYTVSPGIPGDRGLPPKRGGGHHETELL